ILKRPLTGESHMLVRTLLFLGLVLVNSAAAEDLQPGSRPKSEVHLYLLIGQSNMAGRAPVEDVDREIHPRVFSFNQERKWVPAVDPLHSDRVNAGVGLGSSFARAMADAQPEVTI